MMMVVDDDVFFTIHYECGTSHVVGLLRMKYSEWQTNKDSTFIVIETSTIFLFCFTI